MFLNLTEGQKVVVKEWDEMADEFGVVDGKLIPCECSFVYGMKELCGREAIIRNLRELENGKCRFDLEFIDFHVDRKWSFSSDMVKEVEDDFEFDEGDLEPLELLFA